MIESTTLGGGCFWCVEAALKELEGVESVTSGYAGGDTPDPTYEAVCAGRTGHAEVVRVEFDPDRISFETLLDVFFSIHDPTQRDRQGPDVGSQYRSIILTESAEQARIARTTLDAIADQYDEEIVTELQQLSTFYPAESYHQDYFESNPNDAYCRMYAQPKVEKVKEKFLTPDVD